jgi:hypothetical protein
MWPSPGGLGQQALQQPQAMMAVTPSFGYQPQQVGPASAPPLAPLPIHLGHMQQQGQLLPGLAWNLWTGCWDQQSLANSFNTMTLN